MSKHINSWQGHLQRISPYLVQGEGVWWRQTEDAYEFFDADSNIEHSITPQVQDTHFRDNGLMQIQERNTHLWETIVGTQSETLPAPFIRTYDEQGELTGIKIPRKPIWTDYAPITPSTLNLPNEGVEPEAGMADIEDEGNNVTSIILVNEEPENENEGTSHQHSAPEPVLTTKLAKAIDKVLPNRSLLLKLDVLRARIKQSKNSADLNEYYTTISIVKMELTQKAERLQSEITEYEKLYYSQHKCLPLTTDEQCKRLQKESNYIVRLLNSADFKL